MASYLRPDEKSAQSDIEQSRNFDQKLKSGLSTAANIGLTVAGAGIAAKAISPLASKIMPFINKYIPTDVALKGISKVSPEIGHMLESGMKQGLSINEGLDFLKNKLGSVKKESEEKPPQNRSIIQKYSDNLHQYINELIQKGTPPIQAASNAKKFLDKKQLDIIKKIENDYKTDFGSIVESIFGKGDMSQKPSSAESMEAKMSKFSQPEQQMQSPQQSQPQQQAQQGGLDPQVAQILQQGQALLQSFKR